MKLTSNPSYIFLLLLMSLTACGGGDSGNGVSGGSSALGVAGILKSAARGTDSGSGADASNAQAKGGSGHGPQLDDSWAPVAIEGQSFAVVKGTPVQYGVGSQWVGKTVSGSGECSSEFFGSDPSPMVVKSCFAQALGRPAHH